MKKTIVDWVMRGRLLLLGLFILIVCSVQLLDVSVAAEREVFRQLWNLRKLAVDTLVSEIDAYVSNDDDWETFDYAKLLEQPVSVLDNFPHSSIVLYDQYMNLLSNHVIPHDANIIEPIDEPTVMAAVRSDTYGHEVVVSADPLGNSSDYTYYYFRWIPSNERYAHRHVLITAMNMQTITADAPSRALLGWSVRLLVAAACAIIIAGVTVAMYPRKT
ncbi:hypothetical protein AGMMS49992_25750 [Clostridia bacterium]|nr:hypothetical protein AGMMS49992_25750 [Clostridia bacterium]